MKTKKTNLPEAAGILLKGPPRPDHANNPPPTSISNPISAVDQHDRVFYLRICHKIGKVTGIDHILPDHICQHKPELYACYLVKYVNYYQIGQM